MNLKISIAVCVLFFHVGIAFGYQSPATLNKPDHTKSGRANSRSKNNVESFELVWKTIRDTHWDAEKVGESWARHRDELLPRIRNSESIHDFRKVVSELIGRLGQSHFGIIPSSSYELIGENEGGGGNFDIGITVRLIGNELIVTNVRLDSPAGKSGVRPGWSVAAIRGRNSNQLIEKFQSTDHGPQRAETTTGLSLDRLASGHHNEKIRVAFVDDVGSRREMDLYCETPPGKISKLGHLPSMRVADETRTLEGNIGYYKFNAFLDPVRIMPAYQKAVRNEKHSNGIVIDLRGNIGGLAAMTMGMAGEFVTEKKILGTMTMKGSKLDFIVNPRANPVQIPVAIIVDECSISSAEIFAGGLKDNGLATIFGRRTAGLALPSTVIKLPNGDGFQYAFADYRSANGKSLEKDGVVPDFEIDLTKQMFAEQGDPILHAALDWIKKKNN